VVNVFVVWKHGFVRADMHMGIFLCFAPCFALIPGLDINQGTTKSNNLKVTLICAFVVLCIFMRPFFFLEPEATKPLKKAKNHTLNIANASSNKWSFILNPSLYFKKLETQLLENIEKMSLREVKASINNQSISYFGILPAKMIYSDLNFIPTPTTISFTGWSAWSMAQDIAFFQEKKPTFLLQEIATIDNRFLPIDHSSTKLHILNSYKVDQANSTNALLKYSNKSPFVIRTLRKNKANFFEQVKVDLKTKKPIWIKIQVRENFLEKIISFLYKGPEFLIEITDTLNNTSTYKLIPESESVGFLASPIIENIFDELCARNSKSYSLFQAQDNTCLKAVKSFKLIKRHTFLKKLRSYDLEICEIDGLLLGKENLNAILNKIVKSSFYYELRNIQTPFAKGFKIKQNEKEYYLFHSPSSFIKQIKAGKKSLYIDYAFSLESLQADRMCDGIILKLQFLDFNNNIIQQSTKILAPSKSNQIQKGERLHFFIPPLTRNVKVIVDQNQNSAYDQFYISNIFVL